MAVLIPALVPVAFIILVGYVAGRKLDLDRASISRFSLYVLSPALVADTVHGTGLSAESALRLTLGYLLLCGSLYGLVAAIGRWGNLSAQTHKGLLATTMFANTGNMGLPLCAFAFGKPGLDRALVYFIASATVAFGLGPALLAGDRPGKSLRSILKLPLVWALAFGVLWRLSGVTLPYNLESGIQMLGAAAIPVVLALLGMQLAATRWQVGGYEFLAAGLRLSVGPAIAAGIGLLVGLGGLDLQVFLLQSAMPAAVNAVVLVGEFGGDVARVARTIVVSTVLSFFSLPVVLWLAAAWGQPA